MSSTLNRLLSLVLSQKDYFSAFSGSFEWSNFGWKLIVVVNLGDRVSPTDIEEGMRVGVDRQKYSIQLPLPPKIDPSVTMMQVEEKPDVTYSDVGGCKEQIERLREVVEVPLLSVPPFLNRTYNSLNDS